MKYIVIKLAKINEKHYKNIIMLHKTGKILTLENAVLSFAVYFQEAGLQVYYMSVARLIILIIYSFFLLQSDCASTTISSV